MVVARVLAFETATSQQQWLELLKLLMDRCEDTQGTPLATQTVEPAGGTREMARLGPVFSGLNAHYTETPSMDHLAGLAHLSVSQLQRLFKRSTRMSVSDYVAQRRVGHARGILVQSQWSMARIGEAVGYTDGAHFARQFKVIRGCTPSEYRALFQQRQRRS